MANVFLNNKQNNLFYLVRRYIFHEGTQEANRVNYGTILQSITRLLGKLFEGFFTIFEGCRVYLLPNETDEMLKHNPP